MKHWCSVMLPMVAFLTSVGIAQEQAAMKVDEIVVCTSIVDRHPVGADSVFAPDVKQLSCFTRLTNPADMAQVSHVWFYKDKQMTKVDLGVKGKTWRTWSTKTISPEWKGDWRVEVQDSAGSVLSTVSFQIK